MRPSHDGMKYLFNENVLKNKDIYAKIYEHLLYQGYKPKTGIKSNARYPLKVAHTIYCGGKRARERSNAS